MKKLLLFLLFFLLILTLSAQDNQRTVLYNYNLGVDTYQSIQDKVNFSDFDSYFEYDGKAEVAVITCFDYFYRLKDAKLTFKFVNDVLYSVRYYPHVLNYNNEIKLLQSQLLKNEISEKEYYKSIFKLKQKDQTSDENLSKYITILNTKYKIRYYNQEWYNDNVIIRYELIDNEESFIHYDSKLLKKYPDYE